MMQMTFSYTLILLSYIVLSGPGIIMAAAFFRNMRLIERIFAGAILGTALFISVSYIFNSASRHFIYSYLLSAYPLSLLALFLYSKKYKTHAPVITDLPEKKEMYLLAALLISVWISRSVPLYFSDLPPGWDPSFHLILAKKMFIEGAFPVDWMPFESISLHYPLGSHALVSGLSKLSNQPLHQSFKECFPIVATLTVFQVYSLGLSLFGTRRHGMACAFSYAFLANFGSLDYYRWGGLPNAMGMLFLIAAFWVLIKFPKPYSFLAGGLFLADIYLTHHHSMICAFLVIAAIIIAGVCKRPRGDHGARGPDGFIAGLLSALALSLLFTSFYMPGYISRLLAERHETIVFAFVEDFIGAPKVFQYIGPMLLVLAAAGIRSMKNNRFAAKLIFPWVISLAVAFAFFEYAYRLITMRIYGESLVALTPSRFLTNMAYPVSLAAGMGLSWILAYLRPGWVKAAFVVMLAAYSFSIFALQLEYITGDADSSQIEVFEWLRKNTPENSFIINNPDWMPYVSWREGTHTPLPVSEAIGNKSVQDKRALKKLPIEAIVFLARKNKRPVYWYCTHSQRPDPSHFDIVFRNDAARIYKLRMGGAIFWAE